MYLIYILARLHRLFVANDTFAGLILRKHPIFPRLEARGEKIAKYNFSYVLLVKGQLLWFSDRLRPWSVEAQSALGCSHMGTKKALYYIGITGCITLLFLEASTLKGSEHPISCWYAAGDASWCGGQADTMRVIWVGRKSPKLSLWVVVKGIRTWNLWDPSARPHPSRPCFQLLVWLWTS